MFWQTVKNNLINFRLYSLVDLILIGYLAKFSIANSLNFSSQDVYFILGLTLLWFFFNSALELKHNYSYRGKTSLYLPIIFSLLVIAISLIKSTLSLVPLIFSLLLVIIYLQKNRNVFLGNISTTIRGFIESAYFLFAVTLLSSTINYNQLVLSFFIFLIYTARSLVGDIRDIKHNKEAGKKTIPVVFGITTSKTLVIGMLLVTSLFTGLHFQNYLIALPLILFSIALALDNNGYVLHQLMIITTSFFWINFIASFTYQSLILMNIIYLGLLLNLIFYPLLKRKSNPIFVSEN